jgi:hypothetical protein
MQAHAAASGSWQTFNRRLLIQALRLEQHYRENDESGRTADGVFNQEDGSMSGWGLQARWQGQVPLIQDWSLPVWLQADWTSVRGQTRYQGYLQNNGQLLPFSAITGNRLSDRHLRLGIPLSPASAENQWQLVPFLAWSDQPWRRNLVQYSEDHQHHTQSWGWIGQWRLNPSWVLELSHQNALHQKSSVSAPALGFQANLPSGQHKRTAAALHLQASPRWGVQLGVSQTHYTNGASSETAGQIAPSSSTRHTQASAGLTWHY